MCNKFELIRRIIMWILIGLGIGMLILVQLVNHNGLTEWEDPITTIMWIYMLIVFIFILCFHAIPMALKYFKKK